MLQKMGASVWDNCTVQTTRGEFKGSFYPGRRTTMTPTWC